MSVCIRFLDAFLALLCALPMVVPCTFLVFDLVLLPWTGGGVCGGAGSMGLVVTVGMAAVCG